MRQNNIEFTEKRVALFTETTDEALSQYGSDSKVPVLKDGNVVVWDSLAILEHLSEKHLNSTGWPLDPEARAFARSISCEMHSSFSNMRNELPMNCRKEFHDRVLSSDAEREIDRIKSLWVQCRSQFGKDGEWLFGQYSIADTMFAPIALRFIGYNIPLTGEEKSYVNSVVNQPCIIEWIASGKAETEIIEEDEITP